MPSPPVKPHARALFSCLEGHGITPAECATVCKVALVTVCQWNAGSRGPTEEQAAKLATLIGAVEAHALVRVLPVNPGPGRPVRLEAAVRRVVSVLRERGAEDLARQVAREFGTLTPA